MIHWAWLIPAIFAGFFFGVAALACLVAGRDDYYYRKGFVEGQNAAAEKRLKENVLAKDWGPEE